MPHESEASRFEFIFTCAKCLWGFRRCSRLRLSLVDGQFFHFHARERNPFFTTSIVLRKVLSLDLLHAQIFISSIRIFTFSSSSSSHSSHSSYSIGKIASDKFTTSILSTYLSWFYQTPFNQHRVALNHQTSRFNNDVLPFSLDSRFPIVMNSGGSVRSSLLPNLAKQHPRRPSIFTPVHCTLSLSLSLYVTLPLPLSKGLSLERRGERVIRNDRRKS